MEPGVVVRVQEADFDPGAETEALRAAASGAIASFVGVARAGNADFPVAQILLEHYPGMTERSLQELGAAARRRWELHGVRIVHRFGLLVPADRIVFVGVSSSHRDAAFDACRFLVDLLKTQAPFWKRESGPLGTRWVAARDHDALASRRWEASADRVAPAGT